MIKSILLITLLVCLVYNQTIVASGTNPTAISSGTLTISTYPYNLKFPISEARWVWNQNWNNSPNGETLTFLTQFKISCTCRTYVLYATADNSFKAYINGVLVLSGNNWPTVYSVDIPWNLLN